MVSGGDTDVTLHGPADQYGLQGDAMARAIAGDRDAATPLADAIENMRVIDAVFASAESGGWVDV